MKLAELPYVPARNTSGPRKLPIRLIVCHTPETPDSSSAAEGVARYFQTGPPGVGSTQVVVDDNSGVRCVPDDVIAHGAVGGDANARGWHIEIAGYAAQDLEEWHDPYSKATLINAASLCRDEGALAGIPPRWLTDDEIRDRVTKGYCTHGDLTRAYRIAGGHTDPGSGFPRDEFMRMCAAGAPTGADLGAFFQILAEVARLRTVLGESMQVVSFNSQDHDFFAQGQRLMHTYPGPGDYFVPEDLCVVAPEAKKNGYLLHPERPEIEARTSAIHRSPNAIDVYARGSLGERLHWWYTGSAWHAEITVDQNGQPG